MNDEDFDGSALRELLTPAVADRGRTSAPTDAIVAAGRRRVVGRRSAVAGGALAIVAAVPLAASAIAAGPGTAGTASAASSGGGTGNAGAAVSTYTSAPAPTAPPTKGTPGTAPQLGSYGDSAKLPTKPTVIASGTVEGRTWKVTAVQTPGNNALTAGQKCLGLLISVDGNLPSTNGETPNVPYCLPVKYLGEGGRAWAEQYTLKYYYTHGAGTLQMGMVPSTVAKVVAHVEGLAPVTVDTVPAPGLAQEAFYFLPIPKDEQGFGVSFDEYDAQGVKTGTFDNSTPNPFKQ